MSAIPAKAAPKPTRTAILTLRKSHLRSPKHLDLQANSHQHRARDRMSESDPRAQPDPLIGKTIANKFVVEAFIGGGAMGSVYRAKQIALDKDVAVKVLHRDV